MSYLSRRNSLDALQSMKTFHEECCNLFEQHGFDLMKNLGRRNIVMSQAQEKFFADVLATEYSDVICDGRTGEPDINIGQLSKELECKLTSRHKSGAWSFQSDFETLQAKGSLDYLYVLADPLFESFAVLHFSGLTIDDFRPLSNGSRGKVAMYKHKGMLKCRVLVGTAINKNKKLIDSYRTKLKNSKIWPQTRKKYEQKIEDWKEKEAEYSFALEKIDAN